VAKKAGKSKSKKVAARKPAVRRKVSAPAVQAQSKLSFPCLVMVSKGAERIPVTVKDAAHHAQLVEKFGEASIVVQS